MRYLILAVVHAVLFSSLAYGAPTVFLKDGSREVGNSIWTENGSVYLSNSKEVYAYGADEVLLDETLRFNQLGRYQVLTPDAVKAAPAAPARKHARHKRLNAVRVAAPAEKPAAKAEVKAEARPDGNPAAKPSTKPAVESVTEGSSVVKPLPKAPAGPAPAAPAPVAAAPAPVPAPPAAAPAAVPPAAPEKSELERKRQEAAAMMTEAVMKKDPELMKKALELQKSSMPRHEPAAHSNPAVFIILVVVGLITCLLMIVSHWVIFERAGEAGWKSLVPVYNMYVLMEVCGRPGWWMFLLFVPLVGVAFYLMAMISLAKRAGRSELFGVGLFLLPMIFYPILAFGTPGSGR